MTMPLFNIPCQRVTPQILFDLCDYQWASEIIARNAEMLTPAAIQKLQRNAWGCVLLNELGM